MRNATSTTTKGPATLAVEKLLHHQRTKTRLLWPQRHDAVHCQDPFDFSFLEHATTMIPEEDFETFPHISWAHDYGSAIHASPNAKMNASQRRKQLVQLSSVATRLKRKRRGACDAHLVRCREIFPCLVLMDTTDRDDEVDDAMIDEEENQNDAFIENNQKLENQ